MKGLILFFLCTFPGISPAQKTKKVVIEDYDLFARHEYHVLKKDKSVKHGHYKSIWVNGIPRQEGFYDHGKKDSLWVYFTPSKPVVASRGYYKKGSKIGVWEYFDDNGAIINRYNHSSHVLSYTTFEDTVKAHTVHLSDSTFEAKLDRCPIYLPGDAHKFRIIGENIVYPERAIEGNIFGTVQIAFFVDTSGHAHSYEIVKKIGGDCDEEALRVVQLIPDEWAPAIYSGHLAEVRVVIPIIFQLN